MTKKEAVKWLTMDIALKKFDPSTGQEAYLNEEERRVIEAQELAIEALRQPEHVCIGVVERGNGKWIIKDNPGTGWYRVTCSECGEDVTSVIPMIGFFPNAKALWDFCPDCGAEMREEQDG